MDRNLRLLSKKVDDNHLDLYRRFLELEVKTKEHSEDINQLIQAVNKVNETLLELAEILQERL